MTNKSTKSKQVGMGNQNDYFKLASTQQRELSLAEIKRNLKKVRNMLRTVEALVERLD